MSRVVSGDSSLFALAWKSTVAVVDRRSYEAPDLAAKLGGALDFGIAFHAAVAVQEQLGEIAEGDGVPAAEAFVDKLLDDIAEKGVDGLRVDEVLEALQEVLGEGFALFLAVPERLAGVKWAKQGTGKSDEHVAAVAFDVEVLAKRSLRGGRFRISGGKNLNRGDRVRIEKGDGGGWGYPHPGGFFETF
jgi:hypothetical protein